MHGTLEVKQDALTADAVKKPEWMEEVAAEDMTEEQKKVGKHTHQVATHTLRWLSRLFSQSGTEDGPTTAVSSCFYERNCQKARRKAHSLVSLTKTGGRGVRDQVEGGARGAGHVPQGSRAGAEETSNRGIGIE